jgi:hypothetical protein
MLSWLTAERLGFDSGLTLRVGTDTVSAQLPEPVDLAEEGQPLLNQWRDEPERAFCRAMRVLSLVPRETERRATGFTELLDDGGSYRWSLHHLSDWLNAHRDRQFAEVAEELLEALHHQHVRVALTKTSTPSAENLRRSTDRLHDPFNFPEEDGVLRPLRPDEPAWTGARYAVLNHLLWSLGLLSSPTPPTRLTELGQTTSPG